MSIDNSFILKRKDIFVWENIKQNPRQIIRYLGVVDYESRKNAE